MAKNQHKTPVPGTFCGDVPHCGGRSASHRRLRTLYVKFNGRCFYCDGIVFLSCHPVAKYIGRHAEASVDHVVPRSKGGTYLLTNTVLSCKVCNEAKGDSLTFDWSAYDQADD